MSGDNDDAEAGQLRFEAATWFARMRAPDAESHRAAFDAWLARGALHRSAYNRIAETFSAGKFLKRPIARRLGSPATKLLVASLLAAVILVGGVVVRTSSVRDPAVPRNPVQIASLIGEIRRVSLADGSVVTLDSDTLVSIAFNRSTRVLQLRHGRARFEVAHERRPFTVIAGDDRVIAHGTIFDVALRGDLIDVALLRGEIEVSKISQRMGRATGRSVRLVPGQRIVNAARSALPAPTTVGAELDWTKRLAAFDRAPLAKVIGAANQYGVDRIVIADPAVADLKVSGTFRITDSRQLCDRLAAAFNLDVDRSEPGMIVLRARNPQ